MIVLQQPSAWQIFSDLLWTFCWRPPRSPRQRLDWLRRPESARRGSGPPSGQQDPLLQHAKRASPARQRGSLQLTRCKFHHRLVCRGAAPDGDGRPPRAPTSARTPRARAMLAGCAREGDRGPLKAHVNMMLIVLGDACRMQDAGADARTRRLQKIGARFCPGALCYASLCSSVFTRLSGGPISCAFACCTCGRGCVVGMSECTRCQYVTSVYVEPLVA